MSTDPSHPQPETPTVSETPADAHTGSEAASETQTGPEPTTDDSRGAETSSVGARIGADWAAVIVAAVLVLLAVSGVLPAIPFLVK